MPIKIAKKVTKRLLKRIPKREIRKTAKHPFKKIVEMGHYKYTPYPIPSVFSAS